MLPGIYSAFQHWGQQSVWIYSDPHFSDEDLEYGIKNRPSDEEQIKNINSCAGRKDTLIILGDVGNIECVRKLRAERKILVMGNHDAGRSNYERKTETKVFDGTKYTKDEVRTIATTLFPNWRINITPGLAGWVVTADNCLFDEVYEGALIVGEKLIFSHEPVDISWLFNIHGHQHNKNAKTDKKHLNVCSDVIGYKPINLNQWLKSGPTVNIQTIHRQTIDKAAEKKQKRGGKKIGENYRRH